MNRANKNILIISSIILIIIIWSILLYYIKPSEIVEAIGINNGYLITFLVALFAGASAITSTTYYATIITFSLGDLNPILLALMVGPALVIGDSIFFFIGYKISKIARGQLKEKMNKFSKWIITRKKWFVPFVIYFYSGFTPFPTDILMISLSVAKYPFKKVIIPLLLGNITLAFIIGTLAIWLQTF